MPTPTPPIPTFTSDVMVTATQLNAVGSSLTNIYSYAMGGFRTLKPICALRISGSVLIPLNTNQVITWDTADINYDNMWSAGTPDHMIVNTAGVYRLSIQPGHDSTTGFELAGYACVNGTSPQTNAVAAFHVGSGKMGTASALVALAVNATVYGVIYQSTAGSVHLITNDGGCRMVAEWVSP